MGRESPRLDTEIHTTERIVSVPIGMIQIAAKSLRRDEAGTVAIPFAICLLALLMGIGLTLDSGVRHDTQSRLQDAADAAVIAASSALTRGSDWEQANSEALAIFENATKGMSARLNLTRNGAFTVDGSADAPWPRSLSRLISPGNMVLSTHSRADQSRVPLDILYLVDVSGSMGIGATQSDIDALNANFGCAVFCHYRGPSQQIRDLGISTRMDVARDAILQSIQQVELAKTAGSHIRVAVATFSNSIINKIDFTEDLTAVRDFVTTIDQTDAFLQGGTNFYTTLNEARAMLYDSMQSAAEPKPATFVVMVTDGIQNTRVQTGTYTETRDTTLPISSPYYDFDDSQTFMTYAQGMCDDIKALGANMMILDTVYVTQDVPFADLIATNIMPDMKSRMEECVSKPSYLRSANSPPEIVAGALDIVQQALATGARLTR